MTITYKYESRTDHWGDTLWCELYADKHSGFQKFWRWGINQSIHSDYLLSKPNMKKLMQHHLAHGEIKVKITTSNGGFNDEPKTKTYTIDYRLDESIKPQYKKRVNESAGGYKLINRRIEDVNSKSDIKDIIEHILGGFDVMYKFIIGDYDYSLTIYESWNGKTTIRVELIDCNDFTDGYVYKEDVIANSPNVVDEVYKAYKKALRMTNNRNIKESLKPQHMRRINEDRIVPDVEWNEDDEWDDNYNVDYIFQLSRMVMFEVKYYRLGGNKQPYFATSAQVFCRNKKDISRGGQCQADVLKDFPVAYEFWKKWDGEHLSRLNYKKYQELLDDIEILKDEYNWDYTKSGDGFPFYREVELSKQKPKRKSTFRNR